MTQRFSEEYPQRGWDSRFTLGQIPEYNALNDRYCKFWKKKNAKGRHRNGGDWQSQTVGGTPSDAQALYDQMGRLPFDKPMMAFQTNTPPTNGILGAGMSPLSTDTQPVDRMAATQPAKRYSLDHTLATLPAENVQPTRPPPTMTANDLRRPHRMARASQGNSSAPVESTPLAAASVNQQTAVPQAPQGNMNMIDSHEMLERRGQQLAIEKAIEVREGFLYLLQELVERTQGQAGLDREQVLKEMTGILSSLRNSTLDCVEVIGGWEAQTGSAYLWKGVGYLSKLQTDLHFFASSRAAQLLDYSVIGNPLLVRSDVSRKGQGGMLPPVSGKGKEHMLKNDPLGERMAHAEKLLKKAAADVSDEVEEEGYLAILEEDDVRDPDDEGEVPEEDWLARTEDRTKEVEHKAALDIQRAYRGFRDRRRAKYLKRQRLAAIRLQKFARVVRAKKEAWKMRQRRLAAIQLQSFQRGILDRERVQQLRLEKYAATAVQRTFRGHMGRKVAARKRMKRDSATIVQQTWRGYFTRQRLIVDRRTRQNWASVLIQTVWRGYSVRSDSRYSRKKLVAVITLQAWGRGINARACASQHRKLHNAAVKIQAWLRGCHDRKQVEALNTRRSRERSGEIFDIIDSSASKIQSGWRGHNARKEYARRLSEQHNNISAEVLEAQRQAVRDEVEAQVVSKDTRDTAALRIQCMVRCKFARSRTAAVRGLHATATKIQKVVRGRNGRILAAKRRAEVGPRTTVQEQRARQLAEVDLMAALREKEAEAEAEAELERTNDTTPTIPPPAPVHSNTAQEPSPMQMSLTLPTGHLSNAIDEEVMRCESMFAISEDDATPNDLEAVSVSATAPLGVEETNHDTQVTNDDSSQSLLADAPNAVCSHLRLLSTIEEPEGGVVSAPVVPEQAVPEQAAVPVVPVVKVVADPVVSKEMEMPEIVLPDPSPIQRTWKCSVARNRRRELAEAQKTLFRNNIVVSRRQEKERAGKILFCFSRLVRTKSRMAEVCHVSNIKRLNVEAVARSQERAVATQILQSWFRGHASRTHTARLRQHRATHTAPLHQAALYQEHTHATHTLQRIGRAFAARAYLTAHPPLRVRFSERIFVSFPSPMRPSTFAVPIQCAWRAHAARDLKKVRVRAREESTRACCEAAQAQEREHAKGILMRLHTRAKERRHVAELRAARNALAEAERAHSAALETTHAVDTLQRIGRAALIRETFPGAETALRLLVDISDRDCPHVVFLQEVENEIVHENEEKEEEKDVAANEVRNFENSEPPTEAQETASHDPIPAEPTEQTEPTVEEADPVPAEAELPVDVAAKDKTEDVEGAEDVEYSLSALQCLLAGQASGDAEGGLDCLGVLQSVDGVAKDKTEDVEGAQDVNESAKEEDLLGALQCLFAAQASGGAGGLDCLDVLQHTVEEVPVPAEPFVLAKNVVRPPTAPPGTTPLDLEDLGDIAEVMSCAFMSDAGEEMPSPILAVSSPSQVFRQKHSPADVNMDKLEDMVEARTKEKMRDMERMMAAMQARIDAMEAREREGVSHGAPSPVLTEPQEPLSVCEEEEGAVDDSVRLAAEADTARILSEQRRLEERAAAAAVHQEKISRASAAAEDSAATTIQCKYRQLQAQAAMARRREEVRAEELAELRAEEEVCEESAAVAIQRVWIVKAERLAATRIRAVTRIQALLRGRRGRAEAKKRRVKFIGEDKTPPVSPQQPQETPTPEEEEAPQTPPATQHEPDIETPAACTIQRGVKCHQARKEAEERRSSRDQELLVHSNALVRSRSAMTIQRCWRCYNARFEANWRRGRLRENLVVEMQHNSAVSIQCQWRSREARNLCKEKRSVAVSKKQEDLALERAREHAEESAADKNRLTEKEKEEEERLHRAAAVVQRCYLCYNARFMLKWKKEERLQAHRHLRTGEENDMDCIAVTRIQCLYRGWKARKVHRERAISHALAKTARSGEEERLEIAATKIQCAYRCFNARFEAAWRRERRAALGLAHDVRKMQAEKEVQARRAHAESERARHQQREGAALVVQCAWRGYNARFQKTWMQEKKTRAAREAQEAVERQKAACVLQVCPIVPHILHRTLFSNKYNTARHPSLPSKVGKRPQTRPPHTRPCTQPQTCRRGACTPAPRRLRHHPMSLPLCAGQSQEPSHARGMPCPPCHCIVIVVSCRGVTQSSAACSCQSSSAVPPSRYSACTAAVLHALSLSTVVSWRYVGCWGCGEKNFLLQINDLEEEKRNEMNSKAVAIQSQYRGRLSRKDVQKKKQQKQEKQEGGAATKIQSNWRGKNARDEVAKKKADIAAAEAQAAEAQEREENGAASKIQGEWRGRKQRQEEERQRLEAEEAALQARRTAKEEEEASVRIQSQWRGHQTRKEQSASFARKQQDLLEEETKAATRIQSQWRGHKVRDTTASRASETSDSAALAQEREYELRLQDESATSIQSQWRGRQVSHPTPYLPTYPTHHRHASRRNRRSSLASLPRKRRR